MKAALFNTMTEADYALTRGEILVANSVDSAQTGPIRAGRYVTCSADLPDGLPVGVPVTWETIWDRTVENRIVRGRSGRVTVWIGPLLWGRDVVDAARSGRHIGVEVTDEVAGITWRWVCPYPLENWPGPVTVWLPGLEMRLGRRAGGNWRLITIRREGR